MDDIGVHRARLEGVAVVCLLPRGGTAVSSQCVYNVSVVLTLSCIPTTYIVNVSRSCCPCPSALRTISALPVVFQFPSSPQLAQPSCPTACSAVFVDGLRHWLTSREHLYLCEDADGPAKALEYAANP